MFGKRGALLILALVLAMIAPTAALAGNGNGANGAENVAEVTLLHTNDFHGRLATDYKGRGGSAYMAAIINDIRDAAGEENVALLDAGDVYFAAPAISQLLMGESTIDIYNMMGYDLAAFGNHEFDKGQEILAERVAQSEFPWLGANVVLEGTEWDLPEWAAPYEILELGKGSNAVKVGVLGLAGQETPEVTLLGTTAGLEFKDLTETVLHYRDEILAQADALVVVAHMGTNDSGPYDGLVTVAQNLIDAGKPVDLMIGGHQHQALFDPVMVDETAIVAAGYYGRWLGQIEASIDKDAKRLTVDTYQLNTVTGAVTIEGLIGDLEQMYEDGLITNSGVLNSLIKKLEGVLDALAKDNAKLAANKLDAFINEVAAQTGKKIDAAAAEMILEDVEWYLANIDLDVAARVAYWAEIVAPIVNQPVGATNIDLVRDYNDESNVGDIVTDSMRWSADLYDDGELNESVDIAFTNPGGLRSDIIIPDGASLPHEVTWGDTFDVLPFGNTLYLMDLTGAQIQELADQSALLYKGILQTSGASYYWYNDTGGDDATTWGAYGVEVGGEPLVRDEVYRVVTNNFLAGGQDGWTTFADGTNRWDTYYDMQEGFVEYIKMLEVIDAEDIVMDRIVRLDDVVTILHTNDTHGRWPADSYYGSPQGFEHLASLIEAERAHNPNALLLDAGDTFQGNSFAYFFKDRSDNPIAGGMNLLGYDAMVVGNHEFNFGSATFATMLGQADFPLLGTANMDDDGSYGFINDNVVDYINLDVDGRKVTIFGLTNPRVYRYELPTNIPGLTFYPAVDTAETLVPDLLANENPDLLVGLTHVGFAPYGGEVDSDLLIAENVAGIDVIVGGHSHTRLNPATMVTTDLNPEGTLIAQAQKYALYLGKVNVGFIGDEIVLREGYLIPAGEANPDPALEAYLAPYVAEIDTYNATPIGETLVPIDALDAYTEETNGANLQADSAVFELATNGIAVDMHLSGAMSNKLVAEDATPVTPVTLTKGDMFNLMPYENSLVVLEMTGPQIKEVLERSYRNYWYYKYVDDYGGYSHYTTCMLATDFGNQITYSDPGADTPPDGDNVLGLTLAGLPVDFDDDTTTYLVSTVNYVAAGSCNFNNDGDTIWPLDQIAYDTQYYVRDTVINYVDAQVGPIAPAIEGRLVFLTP
ncbi:MAG: 5'-nucleotidase C-terminal domain-containing protein [Actinomycetota bacterium]|nr:5'-nucleotidase C-terminal domain-containing protein [Actinomycetota bacterium]